MRPEEHRAMSRDGLVVVVTLREMHPFGEENASLEMTIRCGDEEQWSPRWGSQEFDDWLDWIAERKAGGEPPLLWDDPATEDPDFGWRPGELRPKPPLR